MTKKDVEMLKMLSSKPGMFHINKVEDVYILLLGYILYQVQIDCFSFSMKSFQFF